MKVSNNALKQYLIAYSEMVRMYQDRIILINRFQVKVIFNKFNNFHRHNSQNDIRNNIRNKMLSQRSFYVN